MRAPAHGLFLPLVLVFACNKTPETSANPEAASSAASEAEAPTPDEWPPVPADLTPHEFGAGALLSLNTGVCVGAYWSGALPLGSAWVAIDSEGDDCLVWLGGETENPDYDGSTTGFCRLAKAEGVALEIVIGDGGPASVDYPGCSRR